MLNLVAPSHGSSLSVGVPPSNQAVKWRALAHLSGAISWLLLKRRRSSEQSGGEV